MQENGAENLRTHLSRRFRTCVDRGSTRTAAPSGVSGPAAPLARGSSGAHAEGPLHGVRPRPRRCRDKPPPSAWLGATEMYPMTVQDTRSLKPSGQGHLLVSLLLEKGVTAPSGSCRWPASPEGLPTPQ